MSSSLSAEQKRNLKGKAHDLKPVVTISAKGVTESVLEELMIQLAHHELIKVKIRAGDRDNRKKITQEVIEKTGSELIMATGNIIAIYKPSE